MTTENNDKTTGKASVTKKEAFFDVKMKPIKVDNKIVEGRKAVVRTDTGDVLSVMTDRYVPVNNKKVLEAFGEIADKANIDWELGNCYTMRNGAKTVMEIKFPFNKVEAEVGDIMEMRGYLTNGFDGFSAAKVEMGFYRLVCKNGMMAGTSDMSISYRHVGNVNEKLVEQFQEYLTCKMGSSEDFIKMLLAMKFKTKKHIKAIIEGSKWIGAKYRELIEQQWEKDGGGKSGWELYNAYTNIMTHKMSVNMENRMDFMKKLNRQTTSWQAPQPVQEKIAA